MTPMAVSTVVVDSRMPSVASRTAAAHHCHGASHAVIPTKR